MVSDITVCNAPGTGTNPATFAGELPHVSGIQSWEINYQNHILTQSPLILCEEYPLDANGVYTPNLYGAGDVPNIQSPGLIGPMSEGFTVLTNGVNVGARAGTPSAPGALAVGASTLDVQAGQGLRLQIVNPSPVRYVRLRLTTKSGDKIPLVRIGGEGGCSTTHLLRGALRLVVLIRNMGAAKFCSRLQVVRMWWRRFRRPSRRTPYSPSGRRIISEWRLPTHGFPRCR
ncbi:MAG: hypothetical protein U0236_21590 [Nitrospira sp.]